MSDSRSSVHGNPGSSESTFTKEKENLTQTQYKVIFNKSVADTKRSRYPGGRRRSSSAAAKKRASARRGRGSATKKRASVRRRHRHSRRRGH
jgi:hypothetical protein